VLNDENIRHVQFTYHTRLIALKHQIRSLPTLTNLLKPEKGIFNLAHAAQKSRKAAMIRCEVERGATGNRRGTGEVPNKEIGSSHVLYGGQQWTALSAAFVWACRVMD